MSATGAANRPAHDTLLVHDAVTFKQLARHMTAEVRLLAWSRLETMSEVTGPCWLGPVATGLPCCRSGRRRFSYSSAIRHNSGNWPVLGAYTDRRRRSVTMCAD